jgi:hypothetical protein
LIDWDGGLVQFLYRKVACLFVIHKLVMVEP